MLKSMLVGGSFLCCLSLWAGTARAVDLQEHYPPTLDVSEKPRGYEWQCDKADVWRLKSFSFAVGDAFRVELPTAQVVLGHHESTVLWAAIFPEQPGDGDGDIVNAVAGKGEHATSVWMRFHPARLREFFPADTVLGRGEAKMLAPARRLAAHKMRSCYQAGGLPMVPAKGAATIDVETREGPRRFFAIDNAEIRYVDAFSGRPLPKSKNVDAAAAAQVFDKVWSAFDREYAMFVVKPDVDWSKLRDEFRPRTSDVNDNFELAELLAETLARLRDLHVAVRVDGFDIPCFVGRRPLNANRQALSRLVGDVVAASRDLAWCVTDDGIGYIAIDGLADPKLPLQFGKVLERLEKTRGLIIDLRYNGGGNEQLAREIAGSFIDRERVYARQQYRNGPLHTDLGRPNSSACRPKNPWHYVGPVVVLQGQRTMSSAESFVLMLGQCPQVTTMGDRTAGSSGNPRQLDAGAGIIVNLPRWNPLDADGKTFDAVGIHPDVAIEAASDAFEGDHDPVLEAALKRLRAAEKFEGDVLQVRPGATRPEKQ